MAISTNAKWGWWMTALGIVLIVAALSSPADISSLLVIALYGVATVLFFVAWISFLWRCFSWIVKKAART
jgi:tellurite resistance protein TehA-like permease